MKSSSAHLQAVLRYQAKHAASGLCRICNEPATHGGRCDYHWAYHNAWKKKAQNKATPLYN